MGEKTCAGCRHWHQTPIDPANLAAPRSGECRESPPAAGVILLSNGQTMPYALYPVLPPSFPACGRHEAPAA